MNNANNVSTFSKWSIPDLSSRLLEDLKSDEPELGRWVDGRIIGVLTDVPGPFEHMAIGVSALPPGTSTPQHSHAAEELAIVMSGMGEIQIENCTIPVKAGDVVATPSNLVHRTTAGVDGELLVLWMYSPPDSADRWRSSEARYEVVGGVLGQVGALGQILTQ